MSLMNSTNTSGPNTDPCSTPLSLYPVCIDLLKICANTSPICFLTSCKNLVCSSSMPDLLSVFNLFSCSTTFSTSMHFHCLNIHVFAWAPECYLNLLHVV